MKRLPELAGASVIVALAVVATLIVGPAVALPFGLAGGVVAAALTDHRDALTAGGIAGALGALGFFLVSSAAAVVQTALVSATSALILTVPATFVFSALLFPAFVLGGAVGALAGRRFDFGAGAVAGR